MKVLKIMKKEKAKQVERCNSLLFYISYLNEAPQDITVLSGDFSGVAKFGAVALITNLRCREKKRFCRTNVLL